MRRRARGWAVLLLALAPGCRKPADSTGAPAPETLVARIDGEGVALGLFEAYLRDNVNLMDESSPSDGRQVSGESGGLGEMTDEVRSRLFDRFLLEQALFFKAKQAGIGVTEEQLDQFAKAMGLGSLATLHEGAPFTEREYLRRYLEDCFLVKRYLDTVVLDGVRASDAEARAHYEAHPERFARPVRVRLRGIRVDSRPEAQSVKRDCGGTAEGFQKVAQLLSEGVEGEQGKDLGLWSARDLPEGAAKAVSSLSAGQVSDIVEDPDGGFSIFLVVEKETGGILPYEAVSEDLTQRLTRAKRAEVARRHFSELRQQVTIKILGDNLGFHYEPPGTAPSATTSPTQAPTPESESELTSGGGEDALTAEPTNVPSEGGTP